MMTLFPFIIVFSSPADCCLPIFLTKFSFLSSSAGTQNWPDFQNSGPVSTNFLACSPPAPPPQDLFPGHFWLLLRDLMPSPCWGSALLPSLAPSPHSPLRVILSGHINPVAQAYAGSLSPRTEGYCSQTSAWGLPPVPWLGITESSCCMGVPDFSTALLPTPEVAAFACRSSNGHSLRCSSV